MEQPKRPKLALTDEVEPSQGAFLHMLRTHDLFWSEHLKFFQDFDVTAQQYNVLRILYVMDNGQGISCQTIGRFLMNRVPDITRLLDRLEQAGLIERKRCRNDRRVVLAFLTSLGHDKVEEVHPPLLACLRERFKHMTTEEVLELSRRLTKARAPIEAMLEPVQG